VCVDDSTQKINQICVCRVLARARSKSINHSSPPATIGSSKQSIIINIMSNIHGLHGNNKDKNKGKADNKSFDEFFAGGKSSGTAVLRKKKAGDDDCGDGTSSSCIIINLHHHHHCLLCGWLHARHTPRSHSPHTLSRSLYHIRTTLIYTPLFYISRLWVVCVLRTPGGHEWQQQRQQRIATTIANLKPMAVLGCWCDNEWNTNDACQTYATTLLRNITSNNANNNG
jgi:hypothetical protein